MTRSPRALLAVVAALVAVVGSVAARADGDVTPPRVTALSVHPHAAALGVGDRLDVDLTVEEDESGLDQVILVWLDRFRRPKYASSDHGGPAEFVVGQWATQGAYRLDSIIAVDNAGNRATYSADGTVRVAGRAGTAHHDLPLHDADFEVDNPDEDVTGADLVGVAPDGPRVVAPGGEVRGTYAVSDEQSGFGFGYVYAKTPSGDLVGGHLLSDGTVRLSLSPDALEGRYEVSYVSIYDGAWNLSAFHRDGSRGDDPPGSVTSHDVDLSVLDFTVAEEPLPAPVGAADWSSSSSTAGLPTGVATGGWARDTTGAAGTFALDAVAALEPVRTTWVATWRSDPVVLRKDPHQRPVALADALVTAHSTALIDYSGSSAQIEYRVLHDAAPGPWYAAGGDDAASRRDLLVTRTDGRGARMTVDVVPYSTGSYQVEFRITGVASGVGHGGVDLKVRRLR